MAPALRYSPAMMLSCCVLWCLKAEFFRRTRRRFRVTLLIAVLGLAQTIAFGFQSVTLTWNPVALPNVAGYHVYYGTSSGNLSGRVSSATDTTTLSGLQQGLTYFFAVAAYTGSGLEGARSAEVSYTVPYTAPALALSRVQAAGLPKTFRTSCQGPVPAGWVLEATEDLQNWKGVAEGTDPSVRVTMTVTPKSAMFFRLVSSSAGISLQTHRVRTNALPNSFSITSAGAPANWTLQASDDMQTWNTFETGTNSAVHAAVIVSKAPRMFFRLRGQ